MSGELIQNVIVAVLGAVFGAVLSYYFTKRGYEKNTSETRIQGVVDKYQALFLPREDGGISALLSAGIALQKSDREVREVIRRLAVSNRVSPLSGIDDRLRDVDLLEFFCVFAKSRLNPYTASSVDKVLSEMKNE